MVRELIRTPNRFMERKYEGPNLRWELATILVVGLLGSVGMLYVGRQITAESSTSLTGFVVAGRVARPVLIVFVLWFVYSIAFHFVAQHFRGRGPIRRLLKGTAWAMIPLGVAHLVQSAALYLVFSDMDVSAELERGTSPHEQTQLLLNSVMDDPIIIAAMVFTVLMLLWSGYLMAFAVKHAKNIPLEKAYRVVAIPVGLHSLLIIWALIQGEMTFVTLL